MIELLFLLAFAGVLFFTGISIMGMALAVAVGFVAMAVAGMIGMVFKLLPWLILIAVVVWLYRSRKEERAGRRY
ncbi:envelope stress response protein PspG [Photobacterium japonica]|uniref:envelope stress response protein PspG n=1 Tax=Photobacterium japonica TaxID=2910235 RepID=UPI003D126AA4